jgi:hypothetical protein
MKNDNIAHFFPALQNHWFEAGLPTWWWGKCIHFYSLAQVNLH